ncbi:hypothetical protein [Nocardioides sp. CFH 31398]|uniref:hypothetical protein n=1 Tax=Nocardioides sp. CFH 31398 TaxID=2919579 RepID=UPI001F050A85|nr:hypothetical protein [Nocardioides sp. CFH 31398]MCH1868712.1 hypothetical protein [Nocardioides sp. CFH 31398]
MTTRRRRTTALLAAPVLLLAAAGCGADLEDRDPARTLVDLTFTDSSVPPDYHRSWQLDLDAEATVATVTDYEEVAHEDSVGTDPVAWQDFLDVLPDLVAAAEDADGDPDDCAGGTTLVVSVYDAEPGQVNRAQADEVSETTVGSCGGGDVIDRVLTAATPLAAPTELPAVARTWP